MKFKEKAFILILIIYLIISYLSLNNLNLYTPDSTRYYIWAQSISKFEGFKDKTLPEPKSYVIHAPLYSLLMTPVAVIFPNNLIALKLATILIACLGLFLFYNFLRNYLNQNIALYGIFILLINPLFFLLSGELLSDVPFLVLLFGILLYFQNLNKSNTSNKEIILFSLMITAAVLLREVGISIMLSSFVYFLFRKKTNLSLTILIISLAFYLLWIYRNEFLVARFELPDLTNSKILTYHFFTSQDSTLLAEFIARIKHNLFTYFTKFIGLILYPIYETTQFNVVLRKEGIIEEVASLLNFIKIPLALISWTLIAIGFLKSKKFSDLKLFMNLFLIFYLLIILIYPINDIRFLLPILAILIFYFLNGISYTLDALKNRYNVHLIKLAYLILGSLILVPNLTVTSQFIYLSNRYMKDPIEFQKYLEEKKYPPSHFTKPLDLAGKWIKENSPESTVVISMWKDLACWIEPRKLIIAEFLLTPVEFENKIRDYDVEFLVSQTDRLGFNEFEVQISQTKRYDFSLATKIGKLNIYRINKVQERTLDNNQNRFQESISNLYDDKIIEAELTFDSLYNENPLNSKIIFYAGVAKSLLNKYSDAEKYFKILEGFPQVGIFLNEINLHRRINQLMKYANTYPQQFANYKTRAAASYWTVGFEKYAYDLLDSVINSDSLFSPAYVFKLHFALKQNNISDAKNALYKLTQLDSANNLLTTYNNLISRTDSILHFYTKNELGKAYLMNAKDYYALGVYEDAIDNLYLCLNIEPDNTEALKLLVDIYILKNRFAPAKKYLEKILSKKTDDSLAKEKYNLVLKYFQ